LSWTLVIRALDAEPVVPGPGPEPPWSALQPPGSGTNAAGLYAEQSTAVNTCSAVSYAEKFEEIW